MKWSTLVLELMSTRISEWSCLIQWKYSSQSLCLAFQKGDSERRGDLGGFVWIVFDQTGPLLGSLLTFSIQRRWGTSRPSHHYKVFDSQTSAIRESRQGALCGCVRACVCLCLICQFDPLQFANAHPPHWNIELCQHLTFHLNVLFLPPLLNS